MDGSGPTPSVAALGEEGVAQHPHQIRKLVLAAQHARTGKHSHERLLHEILSVLGGSAQTPRRTVETVHVLGQRLGVQAGQSSLPHGACVDARHIARL